MKIKNVINFLESNAPIVYQEDYDNSGLIVGDVNDIITNVLITLDCTDEVVDEAVEKKCNLIISHHPLIFSGIKSITGKNYIERTIIKAIKNNISIYAIHTNLDNVKHGVNSIIADRIGLINQKVLEPKIGVMRKLVVYCPNNYLSKVSKSLFKAGAGSIGNYSECSFVSEGKGTFKPSDNAQPFIGKKNENTVLTENKIEVVFPFHKQNEIIKEMIRSHPYEEISYQIFNILNHNNNIGGGIIGDLKKPSSSIDFLNKIKIKMKTSCIKYTKLVKKNVKTIAVCGGSGSHLLSTAISRNADLYISSDFKYHDFFNAEKNIIIADIGHYESEQFTKELIFDMLTNNFTKFGILLSKINTNPIKYL